jgi:hypothetical protein
LGSPSVLAVKNIFTNTDGNREKGEGIVKQVRKPW